jgi:hypothetical protein
MLDGLSCVRGKASSMMIVVTCSVLVTVIVSLVFTPQAKASWLETAQSKRVCNLATNENGSDWADSQSGWVHEAQKVAEKRGLSIKDCQVLLFGKKKTSIQTISTQISTNVYASDYELCFDAVRFSWPYGWNNDEAEAVTLAKSRGLSPDKCKSVVKQFTSSTQTVSAQNPTSVNASDYDVCFDAVEFRWRNSGYYYTWSQHELALVEVAKSRGLTPSSCASVVKNSASSTSQSARTQISYLSDKEVCRYATTGTADKWSPRSGAYTKYVDEAFRRNLDLYACKLAIGYEVAEPRSSTSVSSNIDLCFDAVTATTKSRGAGVAPVKLWSWAGEEKDVLAAKNHGLTPRKCGFLLTGDIDAYDKSVKNGNDKKQNSKGNESEIVRSDAAKRKIETEKQQRLVQERQRKLAQARKKHLAPLWKKNRHSFAVIIGNKNYKGRTPKVSYAHNDADAMKRFVLERLAYREGNVIDLRDASRNEIATMFGNKDTHKGRLFNIIREGKSDVTVFYSGHGVPGLDNRRPYLLPVDGDPNLAEITGYPVDVLYANLAKLPARSITVYLDACFSGESEKGMLISATSGISVTPKIPKSKSWMTVITAAQGDQFASWDEKAKHGLFTKHLLEALNGKADTEDFGNSDGKVSLAEVQTYLDDEMTYQARFVWNRQQRASVRGQGDTVLASVFKMPKGLSDAVSIEEMDATYVVLRPANLRAGPSTSTSVVGKLKANSSVNVTGRVIGKNWYRLNDGSYVFGSLVRASE